MAGFIIRESIYKDIKIYANGLASLYSEILGCMVKVCEDTTKYYLYLSFTKNYLKILKDTF